MKNKNLIFPLLILGFILMLLISCKKDNDNVEIVMDIDSNVYHTVTIGTQVWMVENLKVTRYNDGTAIPNVTNDEEWCNNTTGAYCNYMKSTEFGNKYGRLYNGYAVNTGKLAPLGWHVPTEDEWEILTNNLISNGYNYDGTTSKNRIGKALASATGWESSTEPGAVGNTDYPDKRNITGFTALPGGYRTYLSEFYYEGCSGNWWSSTTNNSSYILWFRSIYCYYVSFFKSSDNMRFGYSVRCIKDN